jgi:hypothetical protein
MAHGGNLRAPHAQSLFASFSSEKEDLTFFHPKVIAAPAPPPARDIAGMV